MQHEMQHDPATLIANLRRPAEGTKVRAVFDRLVASVGTPVRLRGSTQELVQLQERYGLRLTRRADGRYILRGVFSGQTYSDLRTGKTVRVANLSQGEFERLHARNERFR